MNRLLLFATILALCSTLSCSQRDVVARGDGYLLTVDELRLEVRKLGPSANYEDTFDGRLRVVETLATRKLLCDEALHLGLITKEELQTALKDAEKNAVAKAYRKWKIDKQVRLPRIKTKRWIEKLDRRLHLKEMIFKVYPLARAVVRELRNGADFDSLAAGFANREDVVVNDLGWIIWKDIGRDVANRVFRLDPHGVTDVMRQVDGYHVYYLDEAEKFGLSIELLSVRSKRFVQAMEIERLEREEKRELGRRYDVEFSENGIKTGLECFKISFEGGRPSDSLLNVVVASYKGGKLLVADLYNYYYALPIPSRSYIGDFYGLTELAMEMIVPELESYAGYDMGLETLPEVRWEVKKAKEDVLVPLMEDYFRSKISVTEEDMRAYYDERKADLKTSGKYRLRRLLLDTWDDVPKVKQRLAAGEDFVEIVKSMSKDTITASTGGDLGYVNFGIVAVYDSVVSSLEIGEISEPFETRSGIEIVRLEEVEWPRQLSFEEAKPYVRKFIANSRANELLAEWVKQKKQEIGFTINEDLLRTVTLPLPEYMGLRARPSEARKEQAQ